MRKELYILLRISVLVMIFISVISCQGDDDRQGYNTGKDYTTVLLKLNTKSEITGLGNNLPDNLKGWQAWAYNGVALPPYQESGYKYNYSVKIGLMIYNRDLNRFVFEKVVPFTYNSAIDKYETSVTIPTGTSDFYVFYSPDQVSADPAAPERIPYYSANGSLRSAIPWNFLSGGEEEMRLSDVQRAAFPCILDQGHSIPLHNPYNGKDPFYTEENIVVNNPSCPKINFGLKTPNPDIDLKNCYHRAVLSGKLTGHRVIYKDPEKEPQTVDINLFRDFARVRLFVASKSADTTFYCFSASSRVAYLNFPTMLSPSFRSSETSELDGSAITNPLMLEHAGSYSYGFKGRFMNEGSATATEVRRVPLTAGGEPDYNAMDNYEYSEMFVPQYIAPYVPSANSWQASQLHPKILLTVDYYVSGNPYHGDKEHTLSKTFVVDFGEETSAGKYDGPIYPNRDYKVFLVLPEPQYADQQLIYRVEAWTEKSAVFPSFE